MLADSAHREISNGIVFLHLRPPSQPRHIGEVTFGPNGYSIREAARKARINRRNITRFHIVRLADAWALEAELIGLLGSKNTSIQQIAHGQSEELLNEILSYLVEHGFVVVT